MRDQFATGHHAIFSTAACSSSIRDSHKGTTFTSKIRTDITRTRASFFNATLLIGKTSVEMDSVNKINYKLSDVQTRSVVLFPSRAQIFKDIKDIDLKVGRIVLFYLLSAHLTCNSLASMRSQSVV